MERKRQKLSLKRKQVPMDSLPRPKGTKSNQSINEGAKPLDLKRNADKVQLNNFPDIINVSSGSGSETEVGENDATFDANGFGANLNRILNEKDSGDASILKAEDSELYNLRRALIKIRSGEKRKSRTLSDLPAFQVDNNCLKDQAMKNNTESQPNKSKVSVTELSPLPPMCDMCRRRRRAPLYNYVSSVETERKRKITLDKKQIQSRKAKVIGTKNVLQTPCVPECTTTRMHCQNNSSNRTSQKGQSGQQVQGKTNKTKIAVKNAYKDSKMFQENKNSKVQSAKFVTSESPYPGIKITQEQDSYSSCVSSIQNTDVSINDEDISDVNDGMTGCPMCGKILDSSMSNMDKDGHLAACLSLAEDDIVW